MIKLELMVNREDALDIKEALTKIGIKKILLLEVKEYDEDNVHVEGYRGSTYVVEFTTRIKLEIILNSEEQVDTALDSIARTNIDVEIQAYDISKSLTLRHSDGDGSVFSLQDEYESELNGEKEVVKVF